MFLRLVLTAFVAGSTCSSLAVAAPARRTFKERTTATNETPTTASGCLPRLHNETLYNLFAPNDAVWEWIPDSHSGESLTGGTVFVSGTDSPEDGAYYFLPVHLDSNGTVGYRLNLADHEVGKHCLVARSGRQLSTAACEKHDSIFTISCSECPSISPASASSGDKVGSGCQIRAHTPATFSSRYCTSWTRTSIPGVPGYGAVGLKACRAVADETTNIVQTWDIRQV
ncbi:uncharacterized protein JCM15063_004198 [Sporobolomyces koalae]|uniref:uncharacterized protein n=1 Tax=Sporobolomyces koalae TaxID=500713 RepID=UPI00317398A9